MQVPSALATAATHFAGATGWKQNPNNFGVRTPGVLWQQVTLAAAFQRLCHFIFTGSRRFVGPFALTGV